MTMVSPDTELVSAYAAKGSESAFRALVDRHVDLVYATALRQVGDPHAAEELTQNVFVALARKAPRLANRETLAGWLHRTAILEAKAFIRSELRRRRREERAVELATLQSEGTSPFAALIPLLDEALLNLGDTDRLALVLRFLEGQSLRDVGQALGVEEDAARKRVSRALDRVGNFFRNHGFQGSGASGTAALLASALKTAPAGLAATCSSAGLAAGGAATGVNLLLLQLMTLTKAQTALLCALVAVVPLAIQWRAQTEAQHELANVTSNTAAQTRLTLQLEAETQRTRNSALRAQADSQNAEIRLGTLEAQLRGKTPPVVYHWDDQSTLLRVPKKFLEKLPVDAVTNRLGSLSDQIKELLQLTEPETQQTQAALDSFIAGYGALEAKNMRQVQPEERDLQGHKPDVTRVFEVPGLTNEVAQLRQTLFGDLQTTLGDDRFKLMQSALKDWMPLDNDYQGLNSSMAVFNFEHRARFYQPKPGERNIQWGISRADGQGSLSVTISIDDIPEAFRGQLRDWINLAQSQPGQP